MSRLGDIAERVAAVKAPRGALVVELSAAPNPDYDDRAWEAQVSIKPIWKTVHSLKEAVQEVMRFRGQNDLGGGNWTGGRVVDDEGKDVARISYNGRTWEPGRYPTPEINTREFDKERYEKLEAWRAGMKASARVAGNMGEFRVDLEKHSDGSMETRLLIHGQVHLSSEWPDTGVYEACLSAVEKVLKKAGGGVGRSFGRKPL